MTESTASDHARKPWKELPKRMALRVLFGWAVTGGRAHVAYLRQLGFPADRIVGGYDVVDNAMFRNGSLALREDNTSSPVASPYFLFGGRLAVEKNVAGLLAAWIAYRDQGGCWPLVLCGDGPERAALEASAADSSYRNEVFFTGLKTARGLLPWYAHAGCFVLPSTREPWGLVVNEAMAAELPVLVSKCCGCAPDLVHEGVNGFTFDPGKTEALVQLMLHVERMPTDLRAAMGRSSGEIIARFTPATFGDSIAKIVAAASNRSAASIAAEVIS